MSPGIMAKIAPSTISPTQSGMKVTLRPTMSAVARAIGSSDRSGSGPSFGRPKCASRTTLAPLSESSRMVGATRSMRVASVTLPSAIGTLRSTLTSTRLPLMSPRSSRVLKWAMRRLLESNAAGHYREAAWMQDDGPEVNCRGCCRNRAFRSRSAAASALPPVLMPASEKPRMRSIKFDRAEECRDAGGRRRGSSDRPTEAIGPPRRRRGRSARWCRASCGRHIRRGRRAAAA